MSNRTVNICKLILLLALLVPLCVLGYRMVSKGSMDMFSFHGGKAVLQESYTGVTAVRTDLCSCSVSVSTHNSGETEVEIRRVGLGLGANDAPQVKLEGGALEITQPRTLFSFSTVGYAVSIRVPADSLMDYELRSVSGSVRLYAPGGKVFAKTTSGSIRVGGSAADVQAESVSGGIRLYGDERTRRMRADNTSGSIKVAAGENAESIHTQSISGSIKISIPKTLGYTLDYKSVSGSVKDEYRGISYERHGVATQGDGQAAITAHNTSGSIKLTDWE